MFNQDELLQEQEEIIETDDGSPILGEYITNFLFQAQKATEQNDKRVLFYRGQSDKAYSLTPSVFRKGLLKKEHTLIHDLLLNSPHEFSNIENMFERLIKMQHYNLPTRLLDITTNPLVALFFACNKDFDKDGEVIVFYDYMWHPTDIEARRFVALAEYTGFSERQMLGYLTENKLDNPSLEYLMQVTHIPIKAPLNNERIRRQHGAFLVFGIHGGSADNPYEKAAFDLKPYLVRDFYDGIPRSIIIPKEEKGKLLKELEIFGINKAFLFPELEHQATYIKNKHEEA